MKIQTLILSLLVCLVWSQDFNDLVCSGFVEFPTDQKLENLDLSQLEVHLYTNDGQLVEKSLCANNGFYLLPIHDLKDYYLRVSSKDEILQFKPQQARLDFSKKTIEEAKLICDNSINFKWSGFQLTDRVKLMYEDDRDFESQHLAGIELQLLNDKNDLIDKTITQSDGVFTFMDIMPGTYVVKPTTQQNFNFKSSEMVCSVFWQQGKSCKGDLVIQGFDINGSLYNDDEALANFRVVIEALNQTHQLVLPGCTPYDQFSCSEISKSDGTFQFKSVPLGKYKIHFQIQPELEDQNILEIEPESILLTVTGGIVNLKQQLQVNKLTINGRVADSKGNGISGVLIYLDGQKQSTSDKDGFYVLSRVKTGIYTLEGQHDNMIFEPLNNLKLSLGLKQVPNLQLKYLNLCGQINLNTENSIQLGDDGQFTNLKIIVYLENQLEKSEKRTTPVSQEENYKFCFKVRPGKYLIYPVVANPDNGKEIIWQPKTREVEILDQPLLTVNFERKIVILGGSVQFLNNIDPKQIESTKIKLFSDKGSVLLQEQNLKYADQGYATFKFENILNGQFHVTITNPLLCFIQDSISTTSSGDVQFEQKGYSINYQVSQQVPVTLTTKLNSNLFEKVTLEPQNSKVCVPNWDDYIIQVDDCFKTDTQVYNYKIQNKDDKFITQVERVRVQGNIQLGSLLSQLQNKNKLLIDLQNIIKIEVSHNLVNGKSEKELIDVKFEEDKNAYTFTLYAKQGSLLMLKPLFIEDTNSQVENLLFEPRGRQIQVGQECVKSQARFELNTGFVFQGTFEEPIEDVLLTVYSNESEVVEQIHTSSMKFKVGPYIDNANYTLQFEKEGYRFQQTQTKDQNLVSVVVKLERLGSITISIKDEKGQPLPQVMIFISTISKTNNFRINNQTNDQGIYSNSNFAQGEYMVKAYLKEYLFEPSSKMVNLISGSQEHIDIIGKKIAFSIYGRVQDFNKEGVEQVTVEAYNQNSPQGSVPKETTSTDKDGNYRIRGLEPQKKYQLKVKYEQAESTQTIITPINYDISVGKEDQYNKDFIIFQKQKVYIVQGRFLIDDTYTTEEANLHQITSFEVYHESNPDVPLTNVRKLQFHRYFEVELSDPQDIIIKIVVEKDKEKGEAFQWTKELKHSINKSQFVLQNKVQHNFQLSRQQTNESKQQKNNSVVMPLLIFLVVILFFNIDKLSPITKKYLK